MNERVRERNREGERARERETSSTSNQRKSNDFAAHLTLHLPCLLDYNETGPSGFQEC